MQELPLSRSPLMAAPLLAAWYGRGFSPSKPRDTVEVSPSTGGVLLLTLPAGMTELPSDPVVLDHRLSDHPLFEPARIHEMLRRFPADLVDIRDVESEADGTFGRKVRLDMPPADAFAAMDRRRIWMNVQKIHRHDDAYGALVREILHQLAARIPALSPEVYGAGAYLILSSGRASCHFHADPDVNFLSQIRGGKKVFTWPASVLDETVREELATTGDHGAVTYKPEYERAAHPPIHLVPGKTVFIPLFAPHRVENDDDLSVSLSVGFVPRSAMMRTRVHELNRELRRLGVRVRPAGESALVDQVKHGMHLGLRLGRRLAKLAERGSP